MSDITISTTVSTTRSRRTSRTVTESRVSNDGQDLTQNVEHRRVIDSFGVMKIDEKSFRIDFKR